MAREGPFKDLGWGKLGGNKKRSPKKTPGLNNTYRTSVMGQVKQQANAAAMPKKSVGGNYVGIVLRVEKEYEDFLATHAGGSHWMTSWYDEILGVPLPETIKCKVRIPALHAAIPEPDKYGCGTGKGIHQFWINMHPTFYASSQDIEEPQCGDAVVVSVPSGDGSGGGGGGGMIMTNIVKREGPKAVPGGSCPPADAFPEEVESTASGEEGDAMGGQEVSSLPINPFNLPADCDFECMTEALAGIMTTPQVCPGRDPFGKLQECGSPYDKKGIFISMESFKRVGNGMPLPLPALMKAKWADLGFVVIEVLNQTADKDYKTDFDLVAMYSRFFTLGGINVYFSGTPYPGKADKYIEHMIYMASDLPCKGMVMTPSWGYLSPGNKDKYARQAKYLTDKMMDMAKRHMLQLGFSNPWMPSAEYTVAAADGEDGGVSIRYKDSFPYYCFSGVDWSIAQILSRSGRSVVTVSETGEVSLESTRGENALTAEDFAGVLNDYFNLGFKTIIPAFGVMGTGWEDYKVSAEKPPGRLREEQNFIAAIETPAILGEVNEETGGFWGGINKKEVKNWATGYYGATIRCEEGDDDPRCIEQQSALDKALAAASEWAALASEIPEPISETIMVEIPVMEWTDGWADYSINEEGVISYISPTSGDTVLVYAGNTSSVFPHGCGECYDAIMAIRPAAEMVEQVVETAAEAISGIWPPVAVDDPPVKGRVAWSTMWWDWLNAEHHIPCWKSTRWDVIRNFHRHSPLSYERYSEGGNTIMFGNGEGTFAAAIQAANEAIDAWNRVAATNPSMENISIEAFMDAARSNPALLSFEDVESMESYAQAAAHVASSAATEMGYDAEGSAMGEAVDDASDAYDEYSDPDAWYGSDTEDVTEESSTPDGTTEGEGEASGESGGVGLDAYPPYGYIDYNSPVEVGSSGGGWMPAHSTNYTAANRDASMINQIVIHTTAGSGQDAGGGSFSPANQEKSAHYGVNTGGYVFQFVQEKDICWHAGNVATAGSGNPPSNPRIRRQLIGGQDKYQANQNSSTIGIELTGVPKDEANQPGKYYTENCLESAAFLVANICRRNGIAVDRQSIIGHDEIILDRSDPGTWLQKAFPEGIDYPYGGVGADNMNYGPKGGEMPDGWSRRQGSYSPNINQESTFPWERFMQKVEQFFAGAGVPMPPATNFPASTPAAAADVSDAVAAAGGAASSSDTSCNGPMLGGGGSGGSLPAGTAPGAGGQLTAAQIASLGQASGNGWPSGGTGAISSDYGQRSPPSTSGGHGSSAHPGQDTISMDPVSSGNDGALPIFAIREGTVTRVRDPMSTSAGYFVEVSHANGTVSSYMHLHNIAVTRGQSVAAGALLGTMGNTGNSGGVHLHFQLWTGASYRSDKTDPHAAYGYQCSEQAKGHSRYGNNCAPGNQNLEPNGPFPGY